jgi:uncharacterized protein
MAVPPQVTYPGGYVHEVPSDVRPITPVATSNTAFLGQAARGPVAEPRICFSLADFVATFGDVAETLPLSCAVSDFFANGGGTAVVVRVYVQTPGAFQQDEQPDGTQPEGAPPAASAEPAEPATGTGYVGLGEGAAGLVLAASSPGSWGNDLRFRISWPPDSDVLEQVARAQGVEPAQLFDLSIHDTGSKVTETYPNLTAAAGSRRIADVLAHDSTLAVAFPGTERPSAHAETGRPDWWNDDDGQGVWTQATHGDDGDRLQDDDVVRGIDALDRADLINLMVIPPYVPDSGSPTLFTDVPPKVWQKAAGYCKQRRAVLLVDAPRDWTVQQAVEDTVSHVLTPSENAAMYFPWLIQGDTPRPGAQRRYPPAASVAGVIARTDATRGVWKAPAGLDARVDAQQPSVGMRDPENGRLNPLGINCLRAMPAAGTVVWGARTTVGDDRLASQWKYLPVRRMALFLEESLSRSTQWAVFEPNDEPLWASLRLNIGTFMADLFRQGAFEGRSAADAYFVHCGATTTTQSDIDRGIVNIVVGFAPLKPAEFVVLSLQQSAGAQSA